MFLFFADSGPAAGQVIAAISERHLAGGEPNRPIATHVDATILNAVRSITYLIPLRRGCAQVRSTDLCFSIQHRILRPYRIKTFDPIFYMKGFRSARTGIITFVTAG
jgi:hypothetical protein